MTNGQCPNGALNEWCNQLLAAPVGQDIKIVQTGQLTIIANIAIWSLCDQLLPFWCNISVGQVTSENILEPKALVEIASRSPRSGSLELLVNQIADEIEQVAGIGHSVAVRGNGGYLCQMREGIRTSTVNCLRGEFKERQSFQLEFFMVTTKSTTPDFLGSR